MRLGLTILLTLLSFLMLGQAGACDTIFLKNGKKILAIVQNETSNSYTYTLCCEGCSEIRKIDKKEIEKHRFTTNTVNSLNELRELYGLESPFSISMELGGASLWGGISAEYFPVERVGFKAGICFPVIGLPVHGAIEFKLGQKKRFIPSFGLTKTFKTFGKGSNFVMFTNFYSFQKPTNTGFFRISPGIIISNDNFIPILPWIGISAGFYI